MKTKADWVDKKLSRIINLARYNSQWTNVVDKEIAEKSFKLGVEQGISEIAFLIEFYERERVNYKEHEKMESKNYQIHMNNINDFIKQLKKTNERLRTITE